MKKFWTALGKSALWACMGFTIAVGVYIVIAAFTGSDSMPLAKIAQLMAISFLGCALQYVVFSDEVIKSMAYSLRMILFGVPFLGLLIAFAIGFHWFPATDTASWLLFAGIFIAGYVVISLAFEIYYKLAGRKYNGLLGEYKKRRERQG